MSRVALILVAAISGLAAASSCKKSDGPCEGVDSEFEPGLDATGFSVGTNGRGFLSTIRRIGDCSGRTEGWIYALDVNARTSTAIPVGFWPGKVSARKDGEIGVVMGYRDRLGLIGNAPLGLVRLSGSEASLIPLGDAAWDFQETSEGWLASAGAGGSWHVDPTGEATPFAVGPSYCGNQVEGALLLCSDVGVTIIDSSGVMVDTITLPDPATYVAVTSSHALVFNGTSAALIRDLVLDSQYSVGFSTWRAWLSPGGNHAFVNGPSAYWLRLDGSIPVEYGPPLTDVAFSGTNALLLFGENRTMVNFNLVTEGVDIVLAPSQTGFLDQIEQIGPRQFLVVAGGAGVRFLAYDLDTGWGDSWSIELE